MFEAGRKSKIHAGLDDDMKDLIKRFSKMNFGKGIKMSKDESDVLRDGQEGQGDYLNRRKKRDM